MTVERTDPPQAGPEKGMLEAYLDYHRATLLMKCDGLTAEQLRTRACPPSNLTLLGMLRHLVEVEISWFRNTFKAEGIEPLYFSEARLNDDFDDLYGAEPEEVFERYRKECEASRAIVRGASLDDMSKVSGERTGERTGEPFSLRWIMLHMIEEYARHNGHADLLREAIDGVTGE
jgi:hypothetical protein